MFVEVSRSDNVAPGQWMDLDGLGINDDEKTKEVRDKREARVMRYMEKMLKRLYNNKIIYEVHKLDAAKHSRLKVG